MFGYIRPMQSELRVRDLERFKACYCGLCHALQQNYGIAARFILSYELVFLAMLLWDRGEQPDMRRRRCIASPLRKRCCCGWNPTLDTCAGYTVILAWWKLRDSITDESFIRSIPSRAGALALRRAYRKAAGALPEFDGRVRDELQKLAGIESQGGMSLDNAADKFAQILTAAVPETLPESQRRPLQELLYHSGRWIYLIDACDDYTEDAAAGRYNPITARFTPYEGKLPEEGIERLKMTLTHSNNRLCSAFELLTENAWSEIARNIIYLGMPDVCRRVLEGDWPPKA